MTNEEPDRDIRVVEMGCESDPDIVARLIVEPGDEREFRVVGSTVLVPRIEANDEFDPKTRDDRDEPTLILGSERDGALERLAWMPGERRAPGPDEVEIEVSATGLNFRDVMWAQGLLPVEALEHGFVGATLGMECAGKIVRSGAGAGMKAGDRVIAFAPQAFSCHVTVPAIAVAKLPDFIDDRAGAALPTIFLTAQYALKELANLRPGESVLIHGGAGGVGFAAFEIAHAIGAQVFATAGTVEKRDWLKLRGADQVFDSRSLEFADEIMRATGGTGVDVVLNSLAGEGMTESINLLRPFGRFIELGKQDFFRNTHIGLHALRRNISYFAVDLDELVHERPELANRMFGDLGEAFAAGIYASPPIEFYQAGEVVDAFRVMQTSQHLGKVVVAPPNVPEKQPRLRNAVGSGSWLITGGLRGLGLASAEWLAEQGVPEIVLLSRSGSPDAADHDRVAELSRKVHLVTMAADVTDEAAMRRVFDDFGVNECRLEGIIHAAAILDDQPVSEMDPSTTEGVVSPKVAGAALLDRLSRDADPLHFVMFSSIATLLGTPGQGAYVSANLGLEAIALRRHEAGLPALAIGWGPVSDCGMLARNDALRNQIDRQLGGGLMKSQQIIEVLADLISDPNAGPVVSVAPISWGHLADQLKLIQTPLFERVDRSRPNAMANSSSFLEEIAGLSPVTARQKLIDALLEETSTILRQPRSEIDAYRPMTDLGFDSLMAVDLKLSVEESLGVALPLVSLGDKLTIADLAGKLLGRLDHGGEPADEQGALAQRLLAHHAASEADLPQTDPIASVSVRKAAG